MFSLGLRGRDCDDGTEVDATAADAEAAAAASASPGQAIAVYPDHVGSGFASTAPPVDGATGELLPPRPLHLVVEQWDGGS